MLTCLFGSVLSVLVTLIPSLLAIAVLWWLDRYEKEPLWLLSIAFFWGAVPTVIMSIVAQGVLAMPLETALGHSILSPLATMSVVAPLTEETFKALIILAIFFFYRSEFDGIVDGILYGALVGFGFSVVEDMFYLMGALLESGWGDWGQTAALRVGLYNLNHSLFTACVGLGFGWALQTKRGWRQFAFPVGGWLAAVALHAMHNGGTVLAEKTAGLSCLLLTLVDWMGVLGMAGLVLFAVRREQQWFEELDSEVASGVIQADEYEVASTYRYRLARGWQILRRHGIGAWLRWHRFVQMIVDLAYKKHQQRVAGGGAELDAWIEEQRGRISQVRHQLPNSEGET